MDDLQCLGQKLQLNFTGPLEQPVFETEVINA